MEEITITVIDPFGDLNLRVQYEDTESRISKIHSFLVSTKAVCLASEAWSRMFDTSGPWANTDVHSDGKIHLHDDDPSALELVLRIAHLQFHELPSTTLWFEQIYQLAVVCDKYDMVKLGES